jgi:toluene monooxygenase system ferredoxin subunit
VSFVEVLSESELWIGEMRQVMLERRRVLLLRTEQGVHAYEDRCPHLGVPLSRGMLHGNTLTCFAHHFQFDADTGCGKNPKDLQLTRIGVECRAGMISIDVDGLMEAR